MGSNTGKGEDTGEDGRIIVLKQYFLKRGSKQALQKKLAGVGVGYKYFLALLTGFKALGMRSSNLAKEHARV